MKNTLVLICAVCALWRPASAATIIFSMKSLTGSGSAREIYLTPTNALSQWGTNIVVGAAQTIPATSSVSSVSLVTGQYSVRVGGINGSFGLNVPDTNATYSATDPAVSSGLTVYTYTTPICTNGGGSVPANVLTNRQAGATLDGLTLTGNASIDPLGALLFGDFGIGLYGGGGAILHDLTVGGLLINSAAPYTEILLYDDEETHVRGLIGWDEGNGDGLWIGDPGIPEVTTPYGLQVSPGRTTVNGELTVTGVITGDASGLYNLPAASLPSDISASSITLNSQGAYPFGIYSHAPTLYGVTVACFAYNDVGIAMLGVRDSGAAFFQTMGGGLRIEGSGGGLGSVSAGTVSAETSVTAPSVLLSRSTPYTYSELNPDKFGFWRSNNTIFVSFLLAPSNMTVTNAPIH